MNTALRNASSSAEKKQIREEFKVDTNKASDQTSNQTAVNDDSNQRGDDNFKPSYYEVPEGGDSALAGINIVWADQEETFIPTSDILEDYDSENYWSVVFAVSSGSFTQADPTFDATQVLWDDVGVAQTVYRLRVKTLNDQITPNAPTQISAYGQYRESILCVDGDPVTVLVKIS